MEWKTGKQLAKLTGNKRMNRKALKKSGYNVGRLLSNGCYEVWKDSE